MSLPGMLCQFGLKQFFDASSSEVTKWVDSRFEDASRGIVGVVIAANRRAWDVLDAALAPPTFVGRLRGRLKEADFRAARDEVQKLTGALPADVRERAAEQLAALGSANPFATQLDAAEAVLKRFAEPAALAAELDRAAATVSDALAPHAPDLAAVLGLTSDGRTPLFQSLYRYYFRKLTAKNAELAGLLQDDRLRALADLTDTRTAGVLDQLNVLFDSLDAQFAGMNAKLDDLGTRVEDVHETLKQVITNLKATPKSGFTGCTEPEVQWLLGLLKKRRENPHRLTVQEWEQLGDALNVANLYPEAAEAHAQAATVAHGANNRAAEAANYYNVYRDACAEGKWESAAVALTSATALDPAKYQPFPLDRYEIVRILGGGAFGTVFLCRDTAEEQLVAIKSLRSEALGRRPQELLAEAKTLRELKNPNIIGIRDQWFADTAKTRPYFVLEYFDGDTLDLLLGKLSAPDVIAIAHQVARAIRAAHTAATPVYHRDLKPANVMVKRDGGAWIVKVIDFGLALHAGARPVKTSQSTHERSGAGTLDYAPPEQTGEVPGVPVGPYSDVFAFGKTIVRVLFGVPVANERLWKTVPEAVRGPLRELLEHCVEYYPNDRPPHFGPVIDALAKLLPGAPAVRKPKPPEAEDILFAEPFEEPPAPVLPPPPPVVVSQKPETHAEKLARYKREAASQNAQAHLYARNHKFADAVAVLEAFEAQHLPYRDDELLRRATETRDRLLALGAEIEPILKREHFTHPRLPNLLAAYVALDSTHKEYASLSRELPLDEPPANPTEGQEWTLRAWLPAPEHVPGELVTLRATIPAPKHTPGELVELRWKAVPKRPNPNS